MNTINEYPLDVDAVVHRQKMYCDYTIAVAGGRAWAVWEEEGLQYYLEILPGRHLITHLITYGEYSVVYWYIDDGMLVSAYTLPPDSRQLFSDCATPASDQR